MTFRAMQRQIVTLNPYEVKWPLRLEANTEARFGNRTIYNPGPMAMIVSSDYSVKMEPRAKPQKVYVGETR